MGAGADKGEAGSNRGSGLVLLSNRGMNMDGKQGRGMGFRASSVGPVRLLNASGGSRRGQVRAARQ